LRLAFVRARRGAALALVLAVAFLGFASLSLASPPPTTRSVDPQAFQLIAGGASAGPTDVALRQPTLASGSPPPPAEITDFLDAVERSFPPKPAPALDVAPRFVVIATPRPRPVVGSRHRVEGGASWYCRTGVSECHYAYDGGMYAAAGPALRVGDWRGRHVRVCSGSRCVIVRLIDWCQCYGSRVIDLYSDAFRRLAPLSEGTVRVSVSW